MAQPHGGLFGYTIIKIVNLCHSDLSCLGELKRVTDEFRGAFDYSDALDKNRIVPKGRGVDDEYDAVKDKIAELDADDRAYLKEQKSLFGSNDVRYAVATMDHNEMM